MCWGNWRLVGGWQVKMILSKSTPSLFFLASRVMLTALCELNTNHLDLFWSFIGTFRCTWTPVDCSNSFNSIPLLLTLPPSLYDVFRPPNRQCVHLWDGKHLQRGIGLCTASTIRATRPNVSTCQYLYNQWISRPFLIFQRPMCIQAGRKVPSARHYKRVTYVVEL